MLGLCCDKTYGAITNYDDGYDDRNKDINDDDNAASGSEFYGSIFNPITILWSRGGVSGDNVDGAADVAHYIFTCCTIYIPYKYPIKDVP